MEATTADRASHSPATDSVPPADEAPLGRVTWKRVAAGALRAERRREQERLESLAARVSALRTTLRGRGLRGS